MEKEVEAKILGYLTKKFKRVDDKYEIMTFPSYTGEVYIHTSFSNLNTLVYKEDHMDVTEMTSFREKIGMYTIAVTLTDEIFRNSIKKTLVTHIASTFINRLSKMPITFIEKASNVIFVTNGMTLEKHEYSRSNNLYMSFGLGFPKHLKEKQCKGCPKRLKCELINQCKLKYLLR